MQLCSEITPTLRAGGVWGTHRGEIVGELEGEEAGRPREVALEQSVLGVRGQRWVEHACHLTYARHSQNPSARSLP